MFKTCPDIHVQSFIDFNSKLLNLQYISLRLMSSAFIRGHLLLVLIEGNKWDSVILNILAIRREVGYRLEVMNPT